MIIGIDGNEANLGKRVGIGEYAFELIKELSNLKSKDHHIVIYLKKDPIADLPIESGTLKYRVIKPGKLWTQWRLPIDLYLHNPKPDVFFSPSHYAPRFCPVPTVISVMDLSYLHFPDLFDKSDLYQLRNWTSYSVKKASKILTISKSSKNDIIKSYSVNPGKVIVTYPGIKELSGLNPQVYGMKKIENKYNISENFVLFVGTLQPRKNISKLIEAFSKVINQESKVKNLELVVVGKRGWQYEEILEAPERFGIKERVKFLESVNDEELSVLYKNALCYVLPSLYEGFGLPVLEAMKAGCPVITSDVSSLPEAGGNACLYVDPNDVDDIAEKIRKLVTSDKLRNDLIAKGKEQVKKFSWNKTAKETLSALEKLVNIT